MLQLKRIEMSAELELAKHYFELSNQSDFAKITPMFDQNSTFCSRNSEYFIGVDDIMTMQRGHHGSYEKLHWAVNQVTEEKTGVIRFDFDFTATTLQGELVNFSGIEYVIIRNGIIRHIEVRTKT